MDEHLDDVQYDIEGSDEDQECNCDLDYRCTFQGCIDQEQAEIAAAFRSWYPGKSRTNDELRQDCIDAGRPVAAMMIRD